MNAPTLWIFIPGIIAAGLLFLRRMRGITAIIGIVVSCSLAILAWRFPIGEGLNLGIWPALDAFKIEPSINLLGRQLILDSSSRPILVLIYGGTAIWFIGSIAARAQSLFIPLGLATCTVLVGAIAVEPFFYAAPLIELAALVGIPLIAPQGQKISGGVYRFLVYQTTGMMLLLFAGWMVSIVELNPSDPDMAIRATVLLGLGFFLNISAFPFSIWIPMVAEKVQPYAAGFLFFMLSEVTALLGFKFIQNFTWLQNSPEVYSTLAIIGSIMILIGGIWAAFQKDLGRIYGLAVTMEIGLILMGLSQSQILITAPEGGLPGFISSSSIFVLILSQLLPRGLNLALWALALAIIKATTNGLHYRNVRGTGRAHPFATSALAVASLSLAGFPLLAGFPSRVILLDLVARNNGFISLISVLGFMGLFIATLRSLSVMVPGDAPWKISETRYQIILLAGGCLLLLLIGLFPQWSLAGLLNILPSKIP